MSDLSTHAADIPWQQQAIRDRCFHPTGTFIEFKKEEVEQSIPDRFEEQVRRYPEGLAVKTRDSQMTYDELNRAANRVAHAILAACGAGEQPVAVMLEQGVQMIAAILGVLKAGRPYVPLDSSHPHGRLAYVLKDSLAGLLLTDSKNVALARELARKACPLLNMDEFDAARADSPGLSISPGAIRTILYTSGSTGQPKGVPQNHRNMLHNIRNYTNEVHLCAHDRMVLLASSGVAGAVINTFGALLNGAGLFPISVTEEGPAGVSGWLMQEEITVYYSTPSFFRHLGGALTGQEEFPHLRLIRLEGEPVYESDVELCKRHFPRNWIMHVGLASTETGSITHYLLDGDTEITSNALPAGYACQGKEVLLLDDACNRVGSNQIGEIAVKSRYLSPGYWRRPDLTQAAFLPDLDGGDERIYLTGDLGRMTADGCLEHLGRKDFQVKIRGYRIEVTGIEMALLDRGDIKEAVVVSWEGQPGSQRLVAYVVAARQPAPTITALRSFLQENLPGYMVPAAFVFLDALPTLPTGKVDRRGLPTLGSARPELAQSFVGPRTPEQQSLAGIWSEVLGLDQVGIHDNFLELGGDSLLAGQVISRVIHAFRVQLPLRSLFEAPTVADMAEAITQNQAKRAEQADIERMLAELEDMTDDRAVEILGESATARQEPS